MPTQTEKRYYTPAEYLELEEVAEDKSEYHDGEIIPMTGGTTNHNEISLNFCTNFKFAFKGQNYHIYMADVRLWIPRYRRYTYPDVMVIEGAPVYEGTGKTTVTNPSLIVEVLSKSTASYDQVEKFRYYRSIPELREYILIDQYTFHVEQFAKNSEGKWVLTEYELQDSTLSLDSINFQITLSDIYQQVDFELSEE
jgi:Uma2 family endonuclease